jgi:hypothetical protein
MEPDVELDTWRRDWQAGSVVPADLTQRVERETRMMRRFVVAEIAVTVVFGGGSLAWAALSHRRDALGLVIAIWAFIAIAWTISWLLRRGAWGQVTTTTTAFLELSILRCRRRREAVIAQCVLYVMILSFDLAWIYFHRARQVSLGVATFLTTGSVLWVWMITAALAVVAVWQRRRLGRELENLTNLRHQVEGRHIETTEEARSWHSPTTSMHKSGKKKLRDRWSAKN